MENAKRKLTTASGKPYMEQEDATTKYSSQVYCKDWSIVKPVVFCHSWSLSTIFHDPVGIQLPIFS